MEPYGSRPKPILRLTKRNVRLIILEEGSFSPINTLVSSITPLITREVLSSYLTLVGAHPESILRSYDPTVSTNRLSPRGCSVIPLKLTPSK